MPSDTSLPFIEVTAPIRLEGQSDAETVFRWMVTNRYLWMLTNPWADRVEELTGTGRLVTLVGKRLRFSRENSAHPAFTHPEEESDREHGFRRLESLLRMHISFGDSSPSS